MTEVLEHYIRPDGKCCETRINVPNITTLHEMDQVYRFFITEKRACIVPIVAKSYKEAVAGFKNWYEEHTNGVADMLENNTDGRTISVLKSPLSVENYPMDDLIFVREMEKDHGIVYRED